jgi:hypothetical protein
MTAMTGVAGAVVTTGVSTWLSASAEAGVNQARRERDEKITTQRNIINTLKHVEIDLEMMEKERLGLVCSFTNYWRVYQRFSRNIYCLLALKF